MKKKSFLSAILILTLYLPGIGQHTQGRHFKTTTDAREGSQVVTQIGNTNEAGFKSVLESSVKDININWQFTDAAAVGSRVKVSSATGQTFTSWWLNDERVSLYENSSIPVWEKGIETDWEWPIDMTENGEWVATGYDTVAQVFSYTSSTVFWEIIVNGTILGVKLNPDGTKLFIAGEYAGNSYVEAYTVGQATPDWDIQFSGNAEVLIGSGDGSRLIFCQYSGVNTMWVIDAENGNLIFDAFYKNQNPPAISYDGRFILNGDYSGNVNVFEYDEDNNTYIEIWDYKVGGGGTSVWIVGMGISGDGSTLAVGTLIFLTGGGYEGEIYLFNSWSPVPLWIFQNAGDEISGIDFTFDGSLMAATGWGPLDHSKPDFWLFRKESPDPLFSINTPGSLNAVDISPDGTLCAVTGKAVHNRVFGSGGILYNIDSDPDGGTISGTVDLENTSDEKNAKIVINELVDYFSYSKSDGTHEMKYIPAGTYSVTASKIGYYPVTHEAVEVLEGEATSLDFMLEETGNPPFDLFATQGAGLAVQLTWACNNPQDYEGFNLYRKHILDDFFPEEPFVTVSNTTFDFGDPDVMPLKDYYYAVTAIIDEGIESPYSNIAHGWMSDGFVTGDISVYVGSIPVIDGTISTGEWDDAFMLDASDFYGKYDNVPNPVGSVTMYFKANPELTELYVACINENDNVLEDHDEVALYVDDNNDGSYPPPEDISEGNYWAAYYASGNVIKYRPIYNTGGVGDVIYLENPQIEVSDATGVIVYEFMIPLGTDEPWQIHPNVDNQSGLFSFTLDDPTGFDGYWPCWNPQIFIPLDYGQITFGAIDEVPPPPEDVEISWTVTTEVHIILEWGQPDINDFDHFNIYNSDGAGGWEFLESTIGRQFLYTTTDDYIEFYITTVDHAGQESDASEIVIYDITIGINETQHQVNTTIFPNPSSGLINITMHAKKPGSYTLTLFNMQGELLNTVYSGNISSGSKTITWDNKDHRGHQIPPGIYFVRLQGEGGGHTDKLVLMAD